MYGSKWEGPKEVASANRKEVEELEKSISSLSDSLAQNTGNTHTIFALQEAQERLNTHHTRITEGLALQARVDFYEKGEKNNAYFLNLIKTNQQKTTIRKLKHEGKLADSQSEILDMLKSFYSYQGNFPWKY